MNLAYGQMHDMNGGWWVLMILGGILVWGLIIWSVVAVVRGRGDDRPGRTAREILDHRLATGELSTDEYKRLRDALRPPSDPTVTHP